MIETYTRTHIPFPSIDQFRNVVKLVRERSTHDGIPLPTLTFTGSVKLHGTNAGVAFNPDGDIYAQSRTAIITPDADNAGFARYVADNNETFVRLYQDAQPLFDASQTLVVYGEWCGGNIQKGVAINGLPKMFVVFAIRAKEGDKPSKWFTPEEIRLLFPSSRVGADSSLYCIYDYPSHSIDIDFSRPEESQNKLAELTNAVEQECPVGKAFGVSGVGEGIVWWARPSHSFNTEDLVFKVKGEKHSETKVKTLAAVDLEKINSIRELVDNIVTPHRLEKKLQDLRDQLGAAPDIKSTGAFLKIVGTDVHKEEADTIEASGLDNKDIMSAVSRVARQWYMDQVNAV